MTMAERSAHWRNIIDQQAASGQSALRYCREFHIPPGRFYFWRRRFSEHPTSPHGFLEVVPGGSAGSPSGICIHIGKHLAIQVERGFDPFTLRAVVETLSDRCSV